MDQLSDGNNNSDDLLLAHAHIWSHTFAFIKSMSLKCAVELGLPDIIHSHGQPMTHSQLVAELPNVHPSKSHHLHRLMQLLIQSGFFSFQKVSPNSDENGYLLTKSSLLLLKNRPVTARPYVLAVLDPILTKPWDFLSSWFRIDDSDDASPFSMTHGKTFWDFAGEEARFNCFFNEAMTSDSLVVKEVVISKCRDVFKGINSLVDVGGNKGIMVKAIVENFPDLKCTVLDLPHVVEGLEDGKNLCFVGGDMFESIPPADAVMLKMIFHVLGDEDCLKLLKNCKEAITNNGEKSGKVIIIDTVMGTEKKIKESSEIIQLYDLEMLVLVSGQERNEEEWAKLFVDAGFSRYTINPVLGLRALIEVYP
ncbi:trans-resveratrol di-O-methyltransferase-like [Mercurialis annua]|uniref:trans-resveratrol di-O-methyltransferase-like n=1 Tax=Mercurialis annua TaxID=3986 RepID=UPI00216072B6|nr:trans-resveratrol di-O-methyltransferase-like [Mercurialis annua]